MTDPLDGDHFNMTQQFPSNIQRKIIIFLVGNSRSGAPFSRPPAAVSLSYISSHEGKYFSSFLLVFLSLNASHLSFTSGSTQAAHSPL